MPGDHTLHQHTPTLSAVDPRGSAVRSVGYARTTTSDPGHARISRIQRDVIGRMTAQWDPRMWFAGAPANQWRTPSLGGALLRSIHVDAGKQHRLDGPAGEPRWHWNGRGECHGRTFDSMGRLMARFEQVDGEEGRCVERLAYGDAHSVVPHAAGRLICHDDGAGRLRTLAYDIHGEHSGQRRQFLATIDRPDWPHSEEDLEVDRYETHRITDATGMPIGLTDAASHRHRYVLDVAGMIVAASLELSNGERIQAAAAIEYDASGRVCHEILGNGVVVEATHALPGGRLTRIRRFRPDRLLQDLTYAYDPAGNVIRMQDDALPSEWFAGQRIDPVNRYAYDSLSQLLEASGRESVAASGGPSLPELALPGDASRLRNYTESYEYDAGGNLLVRRHRAAGGSYTQRMMVDPSSNRAMPDDTRPSAVEDGFDTAGQQLYLQHGQPMTWDADGCLRRWVMAGHGGSTDEECYAYAADGIRVRKRRIRQVAEGRHIEDWRYLTGLRLGGGMQVITLEAGRTTLRVILASGVPRIRFDMDDRLGSVVLELDQAGAIVTYEGYLPYGGSAWWAGRSAVEARDRVKRHTARERDASGLYCYGHRYYAPWSGRWMSPDPAGDVDGPNRYRFAAANPISLRDVAGLYVEDADQDPIERALGRELRAWNLSRGIDAGDGAYSARDAATLRAAIRMTPGVALRAAENLRSNVFPAIDHLLAQIYQLDRRDPADAGLLRAYRAGAVDDMMHIYRAAQPHAAEGNDHIVYFDNERGTAAAVAPTDPLGRMFVQRGQLVHRDAVSLAFLGAHERSHQEGASFGQGGGTFDPVRSLDASMVYRDDPHIDVASVVSRFTRSAEVLQAYAPPSTLRQKPPSADEQSIVNQYPGGTGAYYALSSREQHNLMVAHNADTHATVMMIAGADEVVGFSRRHVPLPRHESARRVAARRF